jgi:hypothetical protein
VLHRCGQWYDGRLVLIGWPLVPGLVRPVLVVRLYQGGIRLRPATDQERRDLLVMSVWGRRYIVRLTGRYLVRQP